MNPDIVLIDTSVWLLSLRKQAYPEARLRVGNLVDENRAATAPMITMEILGGVRTEEEFDRLKSRLDSLRQLDVGKREWEEAARLSCLLHRIGKPIPYMDILIGTVAIQAKALLLHADRHFRVMAQNTELRQESLLPLPQRR